MESIFSIRLKEERLRNDLTQQQLADLINEEREDFDGSDLKISRVSITRYENGTRTPDYNTLCIISHILNTDIDYLLGKSDHKHWEAVSTELDSFIRYIDNISKEDNLELNDLLWCMIDNFHDLIKQGVNNNLLEKIEMLISMLNSFVNYSVNSNQPIILDNVEKLFRVLHKYNFNKTDLKLNMKFLNEDKISEKQLMDKMHSIKNPKIKASYQKRLDKNRKSQKKLQKRIFKIKENQEKIQQLLD
ncbi:helix-turn-helix domain-containing protein [Clostridium tetani]|uniref:helix-turn-helix domain-containing protein n=1 Tax=Clostridium tetani TaxID=1513 RepID=UPI00100B2711|nr:helix-turn-helix transcriptional regulator [Clostridium tetani]RXM72217.1 hypothetical protein DP143_10515 [Clostridium tetani]